LGSDLHRDGKPETAEAGLVSEELSVALSRGLVLKSKTLLDLIELCPDPGIVNIAVSVKLGKGLKTLLRASMVNQPTRRLGEEQNKSSEKEGRDVLDSKWDTPLARVVVAKASVCSVANGRGDEGTDAEHELLEGCDAAADIRMTELALIDGDDHDEKTDAEGVSWGCVRVVYEETYPRPARQRPA
jgi:hypothetical protein